MPKYTLSYPDGQSVSIHTDIAPDDAQMKSIIDAYRPPAQWEDDALDKAVQMGVPQGLAAFGATAAHNAMMPLRAMGNVLEPIGNVVEAAKEYVPDKILDTEWAGQNPGWAAGLATGARLGGEIVEGIALDKGVGLVAKAIKPLGALTINNPYVANVLKQAEGKTWRGAPNPSSAMLDSLITKRMAQDNMQHGLTGAAYGALMPTEGEGDAGLSERAGNALSMGVAGFLSPAMVASFKGRGDLAAIEQIQKDLLSEPAIPPEAIRPDANVPSPDFVPGVKDKSALYRDANSVTDTKVQRIADSMRETANATDVLKNDISAEKPSVWFNDAEKWISVTPEELKANKLTDIGGIPTETFKQMVIKNDIAGVSEAVKNSIDVNGKHITQDAILHNMLDTYMEARKVGDKAAMGRIEEMRKAVTSGMDMWRGADAKTIEAASTNKPYIEQVWRNFQNEYKGTAPLSIQVVPDASYIPSPYAKASVTSSIKGALDVNTGVVYLVDRNLKNPNDVVSTIVHEALGHYGIGEVLGDRFGAVTADAAKAFPDIANIVRETKTYKAQIAATPEYADSIAGAEVIARLTEKEFASNNPFHRTIIQRMVDGVKDFARSLGFDLKMSDREIRALVRDNIIRMREGNVPSSSKIGNYKLGHTYFKDAAEVKVMRDVQDAAPSGNIKEVQKEIVGLISPASLDNASNLTANILRHYTAEKVLKVDKIERSLESAKRFMDNISKDEKLAFVDAVENGEYGRLSEPMKIVGKAIRTVMDKQLKEVQDLGVGALDSWVDNYFPHLFKDTEKARLFLSTWKKSSLEGGKGFLKERTFPTMKVAIENGLEPLYDNPIDIVNARAVQGEKFILGVKTVQDLIENGLAQRIKEGEAPFGMIKVDNIMSSVGKSEGTLYAAEGAAHIINNYLSPGLQRYKTFQMVQKASNILNAYQLGFSAYHAGFTSGDAIVSQVALGLQKMEHGAKTLSLPWVVRGVGEVVTSPSAFIVNGIRGRRIQQAALGNSIHVDAGTAVIVDALTKGGMRFKTQGRYHTQITENMMAAFRQGNYFGGTVRLPFIFVEQFARPIMEKLVPWQKIGVAADLIRFEIERKPGMTINELRNVAAEIVDSVDNRMGQMTYENKFWNKTFKDLLLIDMRAPGWNIGTISELGGGAIDIARYGVDVMVSGKKTRMTPKMAYTLALPLTVASIGSVINYLYTGEWPKDKMDMFMPRDGTNDNYGKPNRVNLPTYVKDVLEYRYHPLDTMGHKMNPVFSLMWEFINNKDYMGGEIIDPTATPPEQVGQAVSHIGKAFTPFAISNAIKNTEEGKSALQTALPFVGVTSAPHTFKLTDAERVATALMSHNDTPKTQSEIERMQLRKAIAQEIHNNGYSDLGSKAIEEQKLTASEVMQMYKSKYTPYIAHLVQTLSLERVMRVWDSATDDEKEALRPIIIKKLQSEKHGDKSKLMDILSEKGVI